jgi:hypothetical protein
MATHSNATPPCVSPGSAWLCYAPRMRNPALLLLGAALIAAPATASQRPTPEDQLAKLLEGREAGTPVNCLSLTNTRTSRVIDGKAIVYGTGRTIWVNVPRSGAQSLREDDVMVTKPFGSQLCSVDTVRFVDRAAGFPRGFAQLGDFVPYTRAK